MEYREDGGVVIYHNCRSVRGSYAVDGGVIRIDADCDEGRKTLFIDRVIRSAYTLEELAGSRK
ncbi:MAG: hypothetical protein IKN53_02940 [Oscillibacter sp.]|nr:hypothetical protein [Oscillibacter sp.]